MNSKKYIAITFLLTAVMLCMVAIPIIKVDPFFHYHKPLENLEYEIGSEIQRYVNDGIIKHFDYDAMIIGSSMTENFCASDLDALFGVNSIKVPFEAGSFFEIAQNIETAIDNNSDLKMVLRGLDLMGVVCDKDYVNYDIKSYPSYLYNDTVFDDIKYILNKNILFDVIPNRVLDYTKNGFKTPNFDEYCSWYKWTEFSKEAALKKYVRPEKSDNIKVFDEASKKLVYDNIFQNIIELAKNNPDIEFYCYYTPHSSLFFDWWLRDGTLEWLIYCMEYATELMLEYPNIKIFSFFDNRDVVCNLDFYMDFMHHNEQINIRILKWISNGTGLLTKENYKQHFEDMRQFYLNYDYDSIFVETMN